MRKTLVVLAIVTTVGLAPMANASASASPALRTWFVRTGEAQLTSIVKAAGNLTSGTVAGAKTGCRTLAANAATDIASAPPPDANVAYYWGAMLAYYRAGGELCTLAINANNADMLIAALSYLNYGNKQLLAIDKLLGVYVLPGTPSRSSA